VHIASLVLIFVLAGANGALAQAPPVDPLDALNKSIETVVQRVSPTVVQVLVSKYDA